MRLNVEERIRLAQILPEQGDLLTVRVIKGLKLKLALSDEEIEKFKVVKKESKLNGSVQLNWDDTIDNFVDLTFSDVETQLLKESLKKLNDSKSLLVAHVDIYDKFFFEETSKEE